MDNLNMGKYKWEAADESDIELDNGIEARESPECLDVNATANFPGLIRQTQMLIDQAEQGLMMVTAMETRRNKGNKNT